MGTRTFSCFSVAYRDRSSRISTYEISPRKVPAFSPPDFHLAIEKGCWSARRTKLSTSIQPVRSLPGVADSAYTWILSMTSSGVRPDCRNATSPRLAGSAVKNVLRRSISGFMRMGVAMDCASSISTTLPGPSTRLRGLATPSLPLSEMPEMLENSSNDFQVTRLDILAMMPSIQSSSDAYLSRGSQSGKNCAQFLAYVLALLVLRFSGVVIR